MLARILWVAVVAFPVSEIWLAFFKRAHPDTATVQDRGSMRLLWIVVSLGIAAGVMVQGVAAGRVRLSPGVLNALALTLLVAGLAVRWLSIVTLGRLFTVDVAIHADHRVVETGVYRYVRHPSYAGLLLAFLGLGVAFRNWLSLLAIVVPAALAVLNRIRKEEAALLSALGEPYAAYCRRTRRLVPGIL